LVPCHVRDRVGIDYYVDVEGKPAAALCASADADLFSDAAAGGAMPNSMLVNVGPRGRKTCYFLEDVRHMSNETARRANEGRWTALAYNDPDTSARGVAPESWLCVDCGVNTAPGCPTRKEIDVAMVIYGKVDVHYDSESEVYTLREAIWTKTGMEPMGGCLCIGCVEKRLGRRLKPKDFDQEHSFANLPGTERLLNRRDG
jgi:hypothetical protein